MPDENKNKEESKQKSDYDIFIANTVFPDIEAIFTFHPKQLEEIKEECYVVLDTNTLLIPYTVSPKSLEVISNTYRSLIDQKRLIIPGQVAREFAKHRATKLTELYQQLSKNRDAMQSASIGAYPLLESMDEYKQLSIIEQALNNKLKEYREAITNLLERVRNWKWDDPVSALYGSLFNKDVLCDLPIDESSKKKIKLDLANRNLHKIPPGYKDASKEDSGIGDLLIWHTILHLGATHKKSVIFVSGDEKADWYHQSNKGALYPRYELVDEFRRKSNGQTFHILSFAAFLDLYGASKVIVEEVRQEEQVSTALPVAEGAPDTVSNPEGTTELVEAVHNWLASHKDAKSGQRINVQSDPTEGYDLLVIKKDHTSIPVIARLFKRTNLIAQYVTKLLRNMASRPDQVWVVLVAESSYDARMIKMFVDMGQTTISDQATTVFLGYLTISGYFELVARI